PDSVRWLKRGALYKPVEIKAKTLDRRDVLLGVVAALKGLVGFFKPRLLVRGTLSAEDFATAKDRHGHRRLEQETYGPKMRELAKKPIGPGRFEAAGTVEDPVVYGYDADRVRGDGPVTPDVLAERRQLMDEGNRLRIEVRALDDAGKSKRAWAVRLRIREISRRYRQLLPEVTVARCPHSGALVRWPIDTAG